MISRAKNIYPATRAFASWQPQPIAFTSTPLTPTWTADDWPVQITRTQITQAAGVSTDLQTVAARGTVSVIFTISALYPLEVTTFGLFLTA